MAHCKKLVNNGCVIILKGSVAGKFGNQYPHPSNMASLEHAENAPSFRTQWRVFEKQLLKTTLIFCGWQCRAINTQDSSAGQEPGQGSPEAPGMMPREGGLVLIWVEETLWGY